MKKILTAALLSVFLGTQVNAQNEKWFDDKGKILPQYLDDKGLLADEFLPDAYEFTSIEQALATPERVIKLNLAEKGLTEIPPEVFHFPNLQILDLWENMITEVPKGISQLTNLQ